jgi:integrase
MLFRLVRPVKRSGSTMSQFVQRIPADVRARANGMKLAVPIGDETYSFTITAKAPALRFSLRTRDPGETKKRQAAALGYLEGVWQALRETTPMSLTPRHVHALAGELYRAWADGVRRGRERTFAAIHTPQGFISVPVDEEDDDAVIFKAGIELLDRMRDANNPDELEGAFGPLVDRLLLGKGIASVDDPSRGTLLRAFRQALRHAFAARERNASGDYSPDPKAQWFPEWEAPRLAAKSAAKPSPPPSKGASSSLKGLVEAWWVESKAAGLKRSTYDNHRNSMAALIAFLGHDDALRVTPDDMVGFKVHRLATINPRNGKLLSPRTVKDTDLAGIRGVFNWAVANRRLSANPAAGVTLRLGKTPKLRSKGLSETEASAILSAAANLERASEQPQTYAAKRWVPWLCAYTGARVGEVAQLRKQDVRQDGEHWVINISPDAGTVKTNEARIVVLHPHIIEQGFVDFVVSAGDGHLFLKVSKEGDALGPLRGVKNRVAEFARAIVTDPNVTPNHGWRHRFKTVGMQAGIETRVLDAIQGHAPRTASDGYGDVTVSTMAAALAKLPRVIISS